jgi:hypothetical protein
MIRIEEFLLSLSCSNLYTGQEQPHAEKSAETSAQQINLTTHIDTLGNRLGGPFRSLP